MLKHLLCSSLLLSSMGIFSQDMPSVISYEKDTTCEGFGGGLSVYDLIIEDLNADSTYINIISFNPLLYANAYVVSPTYVPGATLRTFQIFVDGQYGIPAGISLSPLDLEIVGNPGPDGGTLPYTISNIAISSMPLIDATAFDAYIFCQDEVVDLRPLFSPAGGEWHYDHPAYIDPYMFDVTSYYTMGTESFSYEVFNSVGCSNYYANLPNIVDKPLIDMDPTPPTACGVADGAAYAVIIGGLAPYDVYWSNGLAESTSLLSTATNLAAGIYYCNVTDANGCKAVKAAPITDQDLTIDSTVTPESCLHESADGSIDVNMTVGTGAVESFFWSTGASTEDVSGLTKGEYTLQVHTDADCHGYYVFNVTAPDYKLMTDIYTLNGFCLSPSAGVCDLTVFGGTSPYSYFWNTLATTEDISGLYPGFYTCAITDSKGCTASAYATVLASDGPSAWVDNITIAECGTTDGSIDISISSPMADVASITWSTGATTEDLTGVGPGFYTCTIVDNNGCEAEIKWGIPHVPPIQPEICMLTVDTSLIYNEIVWHKEDYPGVDGFRIYRETSTYGAFEMIVDKDYDELSSFEDNEASPIDRSWRYKISTYDACGNESFSSILHKTIHVVANTSDMVDYDLSWDDYIGLNYSEVKLERYDDVSGWTIVAMLPFGTNTYTDTPPVLSGLDYMVSFVLAVPCTSTKAEGIDYNSSRSNKSNAIFDPGGSTSKIEDEVVGTTLVYPNPVNGMLTVRIDKPEEFTHLELRDINGRLVQKFAISGNISLIDMDAFGNGVYYLRFMSEQKMVVHKIVNQ